MALGLVKEISDVKNYLPGLSAYNFQHCFVNGHEFYFLYPTGYRQPGTYTFDSRLDKTAEEALPKLMVLVVRGENTGDLYHFYGIGQLTKELNGNVISTSINNLEDIYQELVDEKVFS